MRRTRDSQRKKLYEAESVVLGKNLPTMPEVEKYVAKVTRSDWWKKHHKYPTYPVEVQDGRGCRAYAFGMTRMKFPKWSRHEEVILHELAHLVVHSHYGYYGAAGHGKEFAKILLLLVKRFMGKEEYEKMKASFKTYHIKHTCTIPTHIKSKVRIATGDCVYVGIGKE